MATLDDLYPKVMQAIGLVRIGVLPTEACRRIGFTWSSMRKALRAHPELDDLFFEAMEECRDNLAEMLLTIDSAQAQDLYGSSDPKVMKIISDNIKWLLEKYWPEKFGQKIQVTTTRADDVIIAALDAAKAAINRLPAPAPVAPVIDATVIDITDVDPELQALLAGP